MPRELFIISIILFSLYIIFFSTLPYFFSIYLEKQHSPIYLLWDETLGLEDHELLLFSWPEKSKDLM